MQDQRLDCAALELSRSFKTVNDLAQNRKRWGCDQPRHQSLQKVRRRHKVHVKHRVTNSPRASGSGMIKVPGFEAATIRTTHHRDVKTRLLLPERLLRRRWRPSHRSHPESSST